MLANCAENSTIMSAGVSDAGVTHEVKMEIRQIADPKTIRAIMTAPNMAITCPDGVDPETVPDGFLADGGSRFLGAYEGEMLLGMFLARPFGHNLEVHSYILRAGFGPKALEAARAAFQWGKKNLPFCALVTVIPSINEASAAFVKKLGFHEYSRLKGKWPYKGQDYDAVFYGLEREAL